MNSHKSAFSTIGKAVAGTDKFLGVMVTLLVGSGQNMGVLIIALVHAKVGSLGGSCRDLSEVLCP